MRSLILIVVVCSLFIVGCATQDITPQETPNDFGGSAMMAPYVVADATVVLVIVDDGDCQTICPDDRVVLRIDAIDRAGDPDALVAIAVGDQLPFELRYSARPALLSYSLEYDCQAGTVLVDGSCVDSSCEGPNCPVSSPQYDQRQPEMVDGAIVYYLPEHDLDSVMLDGLESGDKIRVTITGGINQIDIYEIIG